MKVSKAASMFALIALAVATRANGQAIELWKTKAGVDCPRDELSRVARSCLIVEVDRSVLVQPGDELLLTLPGIGPINVSRVDSRKVEPDGFVWEGIVPGASFSEVTFSDVHGFVVGTIALDDKSYRLRSIGNRVQIVEEISVLLLSRDPDRQALPVMGATSHTSVGNCLNIFDSARAASCLPPHELCQTDGPNRIDVMVLHTPAATNAANGDEAMTAWINLQVYKTNRSYTRSNLAQQFHLVHRRQISYTEISNSASLESLTLQCDADLVGAHTLRDTHKADVVVLLTFRPGFGISGMANVMREVNIPDDDFISFEPCAFAVVDVGGLLSSEYTFAHEVGHVMGAEHNTPSTDGAIPGRSFGYIDESPPDRCRPWMTIMSERRPEGDGQPASCLNCNRLGRWSSSDSTMKHCGESTGTDTADNRGTLEATAPTVANFRCGSPTPDGVWMKDTWEDTGSEPDTATAGQSMWKSPYLWLRRKKDLGPDFDNQHLHQNPVPGQVNFVYAKIHNSGSTTEGKLELWEASASTGLLWDSNFTHVADFTISHFPGNTTKIAEFEWTPEELGTHALVARWISSTDPMGVVETTDIEANVRGSNNIVWRDVGMIDLSPSVAGSGDTLIVQNIGPGKETVSLLIKPADPNPKHSYFEVGNITLRLGPTLRKAWREGGYQGVGFSRSMFGGRVSITDPAGARLDGLVLQPSVRSEVTIEFDRHNDPDLRGKFLVDVIQRQQAREVGGVTYEISLTD